MVLIVEGHKAQEEDLPADALRTLALLQAELPLKKAAALAAEIHGVKKTRCISMRWSSRGSDYRRCSRNSATTPVAGELTTTHLINHACEIVMQP